MIEVNEMNFDEEVLQYKGTVVVDFRAPWCRFCREIADDVQKLSEDYASKFKFCELNVDDAEDIAHEYNVSFIPSFMIFRDGNLVKSLISQIDTDRLKRYLDKHSVSITDTL